MPSRTLRLGVILASVRTGRFGPVVARWFSGEAARHGQFEIDLIDLADAPLRMELPATLEELLSMEERSAAMVELAGRLRAADAFAVVTPEYNHSYPASIKCLIDWHPTEWEAKPVGFVSYGGFGGGLRAVEHLRTVFAELHAHTIRNTVSFDQHWERFDADGRVVDAAGPHGAAKVLLDELLWWAEVLRTARQGRGAAAVSDTVLS